MRTVIAYRRSNLTRRVTTVRRLAFFGSENTSVTQSTHSRLLLYEKSLDGKL